MTWLVLASGSASRRAILEKACVPFSIDPADIDEATFKATFKGTPGELALALAEAKAAVVSARQPDALVLGADQVLDFEGRAYDKALDVAEARERLAMLAGRTHYLRGGIVIMRGGETVWQQTSACKMVMRPVSDAFLDHYVAHAGDILTKGVGAYAFEGLGAQLFEAVEGDFFAVLGLPLLPVLSVLREHGVLAS